MKETVVHVGDTMRIDVSLLRFIHEEPGQLSQPVVVREIRLESDGSKRLVLIVAIDSLERLDK